jgi:hypothetical protein
MPIPDFSNNKLGGPGVLVEIDETMLNYKCKSHRGRSTENKLDALVIAEVFNSSVTRVFATVIENKLQTTLVPLICSQVAAHSIIWTNEIDFIQILNLFLTFMTLFVISILLFQRTEQKTKQLSQLITALSMKSKQEKEF